MSCPVCTMVAAAPVDHILHEDGDWVAFQAVEVPGWMTIACRRHADGMGEMTDAEAESFGRIVRTMYRALREATGAARVHVVNLGQNSLHPHAALLPRAADDPPLLNNERMLEGAKTGADPERAEEVRSAIRAALAGSSAS